MEEAGDDLQCLVHSEVSTYGSVMVLLENGGDDVMGSGGDAQPWVLGWLHIVPQTVVLLELGILLLVLELHGRGICLHEGVYEGRLGGRGGERVKSMIGAARESIGYNIGNTFHIMQGVVKLSQVLTPPCLSRVEIGLLEEVDEGVVVGEDVHMSVVHVATPHLECMHNGKHLSIMHRVVDFSRCELTGLEGKGLKPMALVLHEDGSNGKVGGVGVDAVGEGVIGENERRSRGEGGRELIHDLLMLVGPLEAHPFLEEVGEGGTYLGTILVEPAVVVCKAEEAS